MPILVTGAAGFVGRRLVARLEAAGFEVAARDLDLDVTDPEAVRDAVAELRPEAVAHLAAVAFVPDAKSAPEQTFRVNYLGVQNVLRAVQQEAREARVLLVTSGAVYGAASPDAAPFTEDAPLAPLDAYARTKAAADLLGAAYAERGLDVVRARPFNHIGPGQRGAFVAAAFAEQLVEIERGKRPPRLQVGNLDSVRDFLDVEDVVAAYHLMLDRSVPADVYNVASGVGVSIRELLDGLLAHTSVRPEIRTEEAHLRPTDWAVGDARRLAQRTGWKSAVPLATTLARVLDDWRTRAEVM